MELKLDFSLKTSEERVKYVERLLQDSKDTHFPQKTLNYLSDYILFIGDKDQTKKEKKAEKPILTKNREVTIDKRQVSYEGIVATLEHGEDGLLALINDNKHQIMDPKDPITQEEIDTIPRMREHIDIINSLQEQLRKATTGAARWALKKSIIETWQQAYILKASYKGMGGYSKPTNYIKTLIKTPLPEDIYIDSEGMPRSKALISLLNPEHISFLLSNYSQLKQESYDDLVNDLHFLLLDLEDLTTDALLETHPMLYNIVIWKIDGLTNEEIQIEVNKLYGEWHSEQYYSSLWRQRIPRLIAEEAQKQYLIWYYTNVEKGYWKKCSKCGRIKLGHTLFFAKNTSKDGWYSQCKECKNSKRRK